MRTIYIQDVTKQTFVCKMSYSRLNSKTIFLLPQYYPMLSFRLKKRNI